MKRIAVVKVRGNVNVPKKVKDTMKIINLTRVNHCVIIDDRESYKGMLQTAKDYITWGEINQETLISLLSKRGRIEKKPINDETIKTHSNFKSIKDFVQAFMKFEAELDDIRNMKRIFRLHPPRKGYESTKKPYKMKGSLGYRGDAINKLLERMI